MTKHHPSPSHKKKVNTQASLDKADPQAIDRDLSAASKTATNSAQAASRSSPQAKQFWTLQEAAAWVVFRDMAMVRRFAEGRRGAWVSVMVYPEYWTKRKEIGSHLDLFQALKNGQLTAYGRNAASEGALQPIPTLDWHELVPDVDGPYRRNAAGTKIEPWLDICLKRADVERHWRRQSEIDGRTKFDKEWFRTQFIVLREQQPKRSKNKLMEDLQLEYQNATDGDSPERTTIQEYVKGL